MVKNCVERGPKGREGNTEKELRRQKVLPKGVRKWDSKGGGGQKAGNSWAIRGTSVCEVKRGCEGEMKRGSRFCA